MPGYCFAATVCVHIKQLVPVCNGIGCFCFGVIMLRLLHHSYSLFRRAPSASKAENAQARLQRIVGGIPARLMREIENDVPVEE